MAQDTGKFRTNTKDQYYTKSSVAAKCVAKVLELCPQTTGWQWIEPSAGNGVFLNALGSGYDKVGIDLDPHAEGIIQGNFLDWVPTSLKKGIYFGNPPFGKQGSLAKSFIKHAASVGWLIAFILPRSFVKPSMNRAFPLKWHCIHSQELEKNAFEVNGVAYDVPCVFMIWEKRALDRVVEAAVVEDGFSYVKKGETFHIAFKRVGGLAGKCYPSVLGAVYNPQFHYFLHLEDAYVPHIARIIALVNAHVFPSNTVGPRSLSKSEANVVLNRVLADVIHG